MKRIIILIIASLSLIGCAAERYQLSYELMGTRFGNTLQFSSEYRAFIDIYADNSIAIRSKDFGSKETPFFFNADDADQIIAAIDKYLKWDEKATKNKDFFDKQIDTMHSTQKAELWFISGNEVNHYFTIGLRTWAYAGEMPGLPDLNLDRKNAIKLKALMLKLKSGEITTTDKINKIAEEYN